MSQIRPPVTCAPCVPTNVKKPDRKPLREGPAPLLTMPANSEISMNRKAAPSTKVNTAKSKKRSRCLRSADNAPSPHCVAREQQTHSLDKDIAEIEQLGPGRSAGGVA